MSLRINIVLGADTVHFSHNIHKATGYNRSSIKWITSIAGTAYKGQYLPYAKGLMIFAGRN